MLLLLSPFRFSIDFAPLAAERHYFHFSPPDADAASCLPRFTSFSAAHSALIIFRAASHDIC